MHNRKNFAIGSLVAKSEPARGRRLDRVQVYPDKTVATTGSMLAIVSATEVQPADFPPVKDVAPLSEYEPFTIPATQAIAISKAVPKGGHAPILNHALVGVNGDGRSKVVVTADLSNETVFRVEPDAEKYFEWEMAIPQTEPTATVTFDLDLLMPALKELASFREGRYGGKAVTLRIYGNKEAVRLDARNSDGQHMSVFVMPFNDTVTAKEWLTKPDTASENEQP